jgi:hypothetical protein
MVEVQKWGRRGAGICRGGQCFTFDVTVPKRRRSLRIITMYVRR